MYQSKKVLLYTICYYYELFNIFFCSLIMFNLMFNNLHVFFPFKWQTISCVWYSACTISWCVEYSFISNDACMAWYFIVSNFVQKVLNIQRWYVLKMWCNPNFSVRWNIINKLFYTYFTVKYNRWNKRKYYKMRKQRSLVLSHLLLIYVGYFINKINFITMFIFPNFIF